MIYVIIDPADGGFMFLTTTSRGQTVTFCTQPGGYWFTDASMASIPTTGWEPDEDPEQIYALKAHQPQWIYIKSPKFPLNLYYPEYFI